MVSYGWEHQRTVTAPAGGSVTVALPDARPVLEQLTIFALSNLADTTGLSFQPRINGVNFGASVAFAGPGRMAALVFTSGGGSTNAFLIPNTKTVAQPEAQRSPGFVFDVVISNSDGDPHDLTLLMTGVGYAGP